MEFESLISGSFIYIKKNIFFSKRALNKVFDTKMLYLSKIGPVIYYGVENHCKKDWGSFKTPINLCL